MNSITFNQVLDKVEAFYKPLIKENYGKNLVVRRLWSDTTVNASANQSGQYWYLNMYGGLARRVTADGFMATACHEIGHHLGGHPFVTRAGWAAANEGQSDYFATQSCLRNLFRDDTYENSKAERSVNPTAKKKCDSVWEGLDDRRLCYRVMNAGKSLGDLLSRGTAKFETPTTRTVPTTDSRHPAGQCRLDTYVAAALCKTDFDKDYIPGKELGADKNTAEGETLSLPYSCNKVNGDTVSVRPACWFKSQL
jgi:hypothetical protein